METAHNLHVVARPNYTRRRPEQTALYQLVQMRILLASRPELITPLLAVIQRVITTFLIRQSGLPRHVVQTGAVTLIQRFSSAANLKLDGVYTQKENQVQFYPVKAPTNRQLQELLQRMIRRIMRCLVRRNVLIEDAGQVYLTEQDPDEVLAPLQAAACTYRIAFGPRKVHFMSKLGG